MRTERAMQKETTAAMVRAVPNGMIHVITPTEDRRPMNEASEAIASLLDSVLVPFPL